jgi:hypothetical protein
VDRYSFIVVDLHHLLLAGLPAHFESYMPSQAVGSLQPTAAGEKTRDILGDAGFREHTGRMAWDSLVCQLTGEFEPVPP